MKKKKTHKKLSTEDVKIIHCAVLQKLQVKIKFAVFDINAKL